MRPLGEPRSKTRNEKIAAVLHDCGYAETKGTGIRVMRNQMRDLNLTEPLFRSSRQEDSFEVTLLTHHLLDDTTLRWLSQFNRFKLTDHEAKAMVLVRETSYIDNLRYRNLNGVDVLTASSALRRLRDLKLLEAHGKSTATFYGPGPAFSQDQLENPQHTDALKRGSSPHLKGSAPVELMPELVGLLRRLGERSQNRRLVEIAILKLCALRPFTVVEMAKFIQREPVYVQQRFVGPMIKSGELQYLYPERPAHPRQAYVTAPWMAEIEIPPEPRVHKRKSKDEPTLF